MVYTNSVFYRRIDKDEKHGLDESGNIQMYNGVICRNFENITSSDAPIECDDEFYGKLKKAAVGNELSSSPLLPSIIMDVFALLFILICLSFGLKNIQILICGVLPLGIFCYFTYEIIKESVKIIRTMKCIKQRKKIYPVSLKIDGTRLFTDNSGDVTKDFYYVYSEPMLICVPKRIYDIAGPDKSLIGAVVGTGRHKLFYALYVV